MSKTTTPILATGALTIVNKVVFNEHEMDWRVPIATGLAAIGFGLAERVWEQGAEILAWTVFVTVLLTRTNPNVPSPTESALSWWEAAPKKTKSSTASGGLRA